MLSYASISQLELLDVIYGGLILLSVFLFSLSVLDATDEGSDPVEVTLTEMTTMSSQSAVDRESGPDFLPKPRKKLCIQSLKCF